MNRIVVAIMLLSFVGCAVTDEPVGDEPYTGHAETSDFEDVAVPASKGDAVSASFDRNRIVSDPFFLDSSTVTAEHIQAFLENSPYASRSWLADEIVNGQRASDVLAAVGKRHNINPIMLLARMQVEGSHISKTRRPSQGSIDRAFGCGCFDGESCQRQFLGLDNQLDCAAQTLEERFNGSVDGTWEWRKGTTKRTLDGHSVTPANHATASLYAYTPWVLVGRGGNWLVWNVTKKYIAHFETLGLSGLGDEAWVGSPCATDADCNFVDGDNFGFCFDFVDSSGASRGFCSLICEGSCPDQPGEATTFCIEADVAGVGMCASKAETLNNQCADIPGTAPTERDRFIGSSSASARTATVCAPI